MNNDDDSKMGVMVIIAIRIIIMIYISRTYFFFWDRVASYIYTMGVGTLGVLVAR